MTTVRDGYDTPEAQHGSATLTTTSEEPQDDGIQVNPTDPDFHQLPASIRRDLLSPDRWMRMCGRPRPIVISEQDMMSALRRIFESDQRPESQSDDHQA